MTGCDNVCTTLVFFVNGKKIQDTSIDPETTLLYYLRNNLQLCGTKLGCGEGGCGACTVMLSKYHPQEEQIKHYAVNACLTPVVSVHGLSVTTVEGIGSTRTQLHAVQERIAKAHGSQCGFCTPGIVMSMYTLLRNNPVPSMAQVEEYFTGNLCRCTGYRPILDGFRSLTSDAMETKGCGKVDCCKLKGAKPDASTLVSGQLNEEKLEKEENDGTPFFQDIHISNNVYNSDFQTYDPSQEFIFPPELKLHPELQTQNLEFHGPRVIFYRPSSLKELLELKALHPEAKLIVGNTEVGVEVKYKNQLYPVLINPINTPELTTMKFQDAGVQIGASVTLTTIEEKMQELVKAKDDYCTKVFEAILEMLKLFAGKQIRNVAAIGGNIMTGSPVSDLNPLLMAARAILTLSSKERGNRKVVLDENFFTGYRKNIVLPDEILLSLYIPYTIKDEYLYGYKQSRRRGDDIAIVNAGMRVLFRNETNIVQSLTMAFGGMGPTTVMATNTMRELIGKPWDSSLLERGTSLLLEDLPLSPSAPGGMIEYRRALTISFFFKFYLSVCKELSSRMPDIVEPLTQDEQQAIKTHQYQLPKSSQLFQKVPHGQSPLDPIGRPIIHSSAFKQATGEAVYVDDMPHFKNELYAAFVYSTQAHAKIISIDEFEALKIEGVVRFFCARDLTEERNQVQQDEEVFVSQEVTCVGRVIGMVVAKDQSTAQRAAKLVHVQYEDIKPLIITIQDAIREKSYFDQWTILKGDTQSALKTSAHVLEGEMHLGGQEHFYLETQAQLAVPRGEDGIMEIYSSTQNPHGMQERVAKVLGVPENRVVCHVKRLGGGFGGKETRPPYVAMPISVAADVCDHARITGYACKTNLPSNTAFRGFGTPQGTMFAEDIISRVAAYLNTEASLRPTTLWAASRERNNCR